MGTVTYACQRCGQPLRWGFRDPRYLLRMDCVNPDCDGRGWRLTP